METKSYLRYCVNLKIIKCIRLKTSNFLDQRQLVWFVLGFFCVGRGKDGEDVDSSLYTLFFTHFSSYIQSGDGL